MIFDLDGVITDTASVHRAAWTRIFDQFLAHRADREGEDHRPFSEDDYFLYVDGKPRFDGVESFLAARGISLPHGQPGDPVTAETACGLGNRKDMHFLALLREHGVASFPSSVELVRRLRSSGCRTAIISASRNCVQVLEAAHRLGVEPARAAVVEDALAGVEAGHRGHSALVIGIDRDGHGEALRTSGADAIVADLGEVRVSAPSGDER